MGFSRQRAPPTKYKIGHGDNPEEQVPRRPFGDATEKAQQVNIERAEYANMLRAFINGGVGRGEGERERDYEGLRQSNIK